MLLEMAPTPMIVVGSIVLAVPLLWLLYVLIWLWRHPDAKVEKEYEI